MLVKIIEKDSSDYVKALALRVAVLRKPLGLSYAQTDLDLEKDDIHFVATHDQDIIGCLLVRPMSKTIIKLRQVAVSFSYQKKGIGQKLVAASEAYALSHGFQKIELSARIDSVPFYERLGYRVTGLTYIEVTLPHQKMEKSLDQ